MRLQTLYLPSGGPGSKIRFALIADQMPAGRGSLDMDVLQKFGREIGAAGVLVTAATVDIPTELEVAEASPDNTFVDVDPDMLGAAVARAVRTHLETQGGTLRGLR